MKSHFANARWSRSFVALAILLVAVLAAPSAFGQRTKQSKVESTGTTLDGTDSSTFDSSKADRLGSKIQSAPTTQTNTAGAIFTSMPTTGGQPALTAPVEVWIVNANTTYPGKQFVFLNGGPRNESSSGLTPGLYFFQLTDPSGTALLSTDPAVCRTVVVAASDTPGADANDVERIFGPGQPSTDAGCEHLTLGEDDVHGGIPIQLCRKDAALAEDWANCFLDTPNNGGEYKLWLIPVGNVTAGGSTLEDGAALEFSQGGVKTDNFKLQLGDGDGCEPACDWPLEGRKFYDTNGNGVVDEGEEFISGWKVQGVGDNPMVCLVDLVEGQCPEGQSVLDTNLFTDSGEYYSATVSTDINGVYSFAHLTTGGTYGVCEIMPSASGGIFWQATTVRPANSYGGTSWESQIFCPRHVQYDGVGGFDELANNAFNEFACLNEPASLLEGGFAFPVGDVTGDEQDDTVNILPGRGPADFGNRCEGGNGRTIGYWGNRNGANTFGNIDGLAVVNSIEKLQNAAGCRAPFASHEDFKAFLRDVKATNMAYMLSAQLAASMLNVEAFDSGVPGVGLSADTLVYAPQLSFANTEGYARLGDIIDAARAALLTADCSPVLPGNHLRGLLGDLKDALDNANNNIGLLIPPDACPLLQRVEGKLVAIYAGTETCSSTDLLNVTTGVDAGIGPAPAPEQ
jgi:hypothetical protein